MKWNESGFRPPLCTYRLNWARRTTWGWWDEWDDTVLQTQEPWRSEAEYATSRSRRLPTILSRRSQVRPPLWHPGFKETISQVGVYRYTCWWKYFTSKQILPFAFEEQHSAVSAHFTSKQELPFAIQEYSDTENPGIIRKKKINVLEKS